LDTEKQIRAVCEKFQLRGEYQSYRVLTSGHINNSYQVIMLRDGKLKDYILQKINTAFNHPLAFYIFSSNKRRINHALTTCDFGGGCVNDCIIHLATSAMAFGGLKHSGIGAYHGKVGFETFSHIKSIVDKKTWLDLPLRYQPYSKIKTKLIKTFVK